MIQDSALICRGARRLPFLLEDPLSKGTPTKQASSPATPSCIGSLIILAMPPDLGMTLAESGSFFFPCPRPDVQATPLTEVARCGRDCATALAKCRRYIAFVSL